MQKSSKDYFGTYSGAVQTEWLSDGRQMKLLNDFIFEDPNGLKWKAPKGSIVDGASIPTFAWSFIGAPFSGEYRDASVIHDIACQQKKRTWEVVHLAFYYAMRASDVNVLQAKIMYAAVYHFGPRWAIKKKMVTRFSNSRAINKVLKFPGLESSVNLQLPQTLGTEQAVELSVKIPAPPKVMMTATFDELVNALEAAEKSATPYSLEAIRDFTSISE